MSFRQAGLAPGGAQPPTLHLPVAAGQAWEKGALLIADANGQWAECGADPAAVGAVAANAYGADTSGFVRTARKEFPPGEMVAVLVGGLVPFRAKYVGSLPAVTGGSFGVIRDTDGLWKVDFNEVTALRVKVAPNGLRLASAPFNRNEVIVFFLPTIVQALG